MPSGVRSLVRILSNKPAGKCCRLFLVRSIRSTTSAMSSNADSSISVNWESESLKNFISLSPANVFLVIFFFSRFPLNDTFVKWKSISVAIRSSRLSGLRKSSKISVINVPVSGSNRYGSMTVSSIFLSSR